MLITINRAPVMTLWAAVVAQRLGHDRDTALSLAKVVAGLNAQAKGKTLGIYPHGDPGRARSDLGEDLWVPLLGRGVPARRTESGLRGVVKDKPVEPASVQSYLVSRFKGALDEARSAMESLAASMPADRLADEAYSLYERFRPAIPRGKAGWGAAGELDLDKVRALAGG
jgi:hypothetical protein